MKKSYLVVYDYGTGGVWAIIHARSKDEIVRKYPMLTVQDDRPNWMTDAYYKTIESNRSFDIDDEPSGWLQTVTKSN